MKIYAHVVDGVVDEIIEPATYDSEVEIDGVVHRAGEEIPVANRFHPDFVRSLVDITDVVPMPNQRWTYDGTTFKAPD